MHTKNATHAENSIDCVRCFCMHALRFSVFWLRRKPCVGCVACLVYDNLETARRPTKTDLKACFQAGVRNAMDATHAGHATQIKKTATHAMNAHEKCNGRKDRIGCMCCVFRVRALRISGFLTALRSLRVEYDTLKTACCRPMSRPIHLFTFLWWVSGSAVRRNVVMNNYVMSNYVTLWRQRPVCQFSWCPQRDTSPLWLVIKLQGDSTSDC